jgi:signal transduction histidine kinase
VQTAVVSVVDARRQTFKGHDGLPPDLQTEGGLAMRDSLCRLVVASGERLLVRDGRTDPLVRDSAVVLAHHQSAYAGVPLEVEDGEVVGTLCVFDPDPHEWTDSDVELLNELAALAVSEMEYRLRLKEVGGLESLALRLPEPVERLGEAVRSTAAIAEDPFDPRLPRMADVMRARLRPVETLTEDLHEAAGRHRDRRPAETVTVDLRQLVERVVRLVRSSVREEDLAVDLPEDPVPVLATLPDLDRALTLAVMTAVHHLSDGHVTVDVRPAARGGGTLRVSHPGRAVPVSDLLRVVSAFGSDDDRSVDVRVRDGVTRARSEQATAVTAEGGTTLEVSLAGPQHSRVPQPRAS